MAIDIEWYVSSKQKGDNDKQTRLYPRISDNAMVDFQLLCEKVAKHGGHTRGEVKSVVSDVVDVVAELLREGRSVDLDELGIFRLAIGADSSVTENTKNKNAKVFVRGVNFQPHKTLMDAIGGPEFRTVPRNTVSETMTTVQLQNAVLKYFETHDSITRLEFEKLCRLKRTTAYIRLTELVDSGFLRKVGHNKDTCYEIQR